MLLNFYHVQVLVDDDCEYGNCEFEVIDGNKLKYNIMTSSYNVWGTENIDFSRGKYVRVSKVLDNGQIVLDCGAILLQKQYEELVSYIRENTKELLSVSEKSASNIIVRAMKLLDNKEFYDITGNLIEKYFLNIYCDFEKLKKFESAFLLEYENTISISEPDPYGIIYYLDFDEVNRICCIERVKDISYSIATLYKLIIKDGEVFNEVINQYYKPFTQILVENSNISKSEAPFVTYVAFKLRVIDLVGKKWLDNYSNYFENIEQKSLYECFSGYFKIDDIDRDNTITFCQFVYFLIYMKKLDWKLGYRNNFITVFETYKKAKEEYEIEIKKQKLYSTLSVKNVAKLYTLDDIDMMTGVEFENFISCYFKSKGYKTELTKASGDQGIDVIIEKDGYRIGVQTKCYSSSVGNSAIQEAVAGKRFYNLDKVMVITNNYYTNSAETLAEANDVVLWNRDMLDKKLPVSFE